MKRFIEKVKIGSWPGVVLGLAVGLGVGLLLGGESQHKHGRAEQMGDSSVAQVWTCSMHPQVRMPQPGQCPICAMDLIALETEAAGDELGPRQLRLSQAAQQLAGIQVSPARRQSVAVEARMVGKIAYDESRLKHISAWIPGRIDRLFVDYTGVPVREGDHVAELYSPDLLTAQEELIQALRATEKLGGGGIMAATAKQTVQSAREKLRLLGLKPQQIAAIERRRRPSDQVTIFAPEGGVVVEKHVSEGVYVQTGTRIYTIADLSKLWLYLDAYESDLPWIHYGQQVEFETEAYAGEKFSGRVAFISPVLDERSRTVKVRVNVDNADGHLKPGMFARAVVRAQVADKGSVIDPQLADKWIGPMHPEIVRDSPGRCDICGMELIKAADLGYVNAAAAQRAAPLVVPASAVLLTGRRAVAYVAVPDRQGVFEGRELVLGPRAGDYYVVEEGLREGEMVVVNGNFKIDSALQILAKPSMMNPSAAGPAPGHHHGAAEVVPGGGAPTDAMAKPVIGEHGQEGVHKGHEHEDEHSGHEQKDDHSGHGHGGRHE